ncbi:hypothetical protein PENVUL_c215G10348, partial [Penicillium vulpinum]
LWTSGGPAPRGPPDTRVVSSLGRSHLCAPFSDSLFAASYCRQNDEPGDLTAHCSNSRLLCSLPRDTSYLCGGPTAILAVCDEMSLPSYSNGDWRAYIPSRGAAVTVSVVPNRRYLPVVFHQRCCLHNGRMESETLGIFPKRGSHELGERFSLARYRATPQPSDLPWPVRAALDATSRLSGFLSAPSVLCCILGKWTNSKNSPHGSRAATRAYAKAVSRSTEIPGQAFGYDTRTLRTPSRLLPVRYNPLRRGGYWIFSSAFIHL